MKFELNKQFIENNPQSSNLVLQGFGDNKHIYFIVCFTKIFESNKKIQQLRKDYSHKTSAYNVSNTNNIIKIPERLIDESNFDKISHYNYVKLDNIIIIWSKQGFELFQKDIKNTKEKTGLPF